MFDRSRRLAVWFTLSMGSILVLFAFTFYHHQVTEQKREFDQEIYARAKKIAQNSKYKYTQKRRSDREKIFALQPLISAESNLVCTRWYDTQKRPVKSIGACPKIAFSDFRLAV